MYATRRFSPPWRDVGPPGGAHAFADRFAFLDRCGAAWRHAGRIGTIADPLSMVRETLWELDGRTNVLLFHELSTV
jgi:hypothetical protein